MIAAHERDMPIFLSSLRLRKVMVWLALCAMGFAATVPTVSRWLAGASYGQDRIAICDQHGITLLTASQWAALQSNAQSQDHQTGDDQRGPPADQSGDAGDCCLYCTLIHHSPYIATAAAAFAPHTPPQAAPRLSAPVAAPVLPIWRRPQLPQAPPAWA